MVGSAGNKPNDEAKSNGNAGEASREGTLKDGAAIAAALVTLTAFGVFVIFLLLRLGIDQTQWDRAVYLLSGIEAIVFAGTGFLFGKEVHRAQAKSVEKQAQSEQERAETAEARADQNAEDAMNGRALAAAVLTREEWSPRVSRAAGRLLIADTEPQEQEPDDDVIFSLARKLMPNV